MAYADGQAQDEPAIYSPDRVLFRTDHSGQQIVIRPNQFLTSAEVGRVEAAFAEIMSEIKGEIVTEVTLTVGDPVRGVWRRYTTTEDVDVIRVVQGLRDRGIHAQPNHVYFVTTLAPSATRQFAPNLFAPNLFAPNLFAPNLFAGGGGACGCGCGCPSALTDAQSVQVPELAARPAPRPAQPRPRKRATQRVEIHVIDVATPGKVARTHRAGELEDPNHLTGDAIDENGDGWADPAVGHGDFVKSIVEINSGLEATLWQAADPLGAIDDSALVCALHTVDRHVRKAEVKARKEKRKIVNLSLSGYNEGDRPSALLADQIRAMVAAGWVVVASAGNNRSCRLAWPAALPDVVAVGAVGPWGPAWFSNYGPWVDASASGVDVVAEYPDLSNGKVSVAQVDDASQPFGKRELKTGDFNTGWATWSGTSFSAPLVTARLAMAMESAKGGTPRTQVIEQALQQVVRDPKLDHGPSYGTLVR
jgi:hypothetical protein